MTLPDLTRCMDDLNAGQLTPALTRLYGKEEVDRQRDRLARLLERAREHFDIEHCLILSAPGRTELGGNHTDHNNGRVLAASVNLDCLAVAGPATENEVTILSEGFDDPIRVSLDDLDPRDEEHGTPEALVRGVAYNLRRAGYALGGFKAVVSSTIPLGAGLSSSAAFEVLTGEMFSRLHNNGEIPPLEIARAAKRAENIHFGKPCGFMDQIACAYEGVLHIDFKDPDQPGIERVDTDLMGCGLTLTVVDTRGSHADLTPLYAAIAEEMGAAAEILGQPVARGLSMDQVIAEAQRIRAGAGDRALLRLMHFIEEDRRAAEQARSLRLHDMTAFLKLVHASGDSSWRLLQNVSGDDPASQPLCVALAMTEQFLCGTGAWRVHGGGFAGTIQAYIPDMELDRYTRLMETLFGQGAVIPLKIRRPGNRVLHAES